MSARRSNTPLVFAPHLSPHACLICHLLLSQTKALSLFTQPNPTLCIKGHKTSLTMCTKVHILNS